MKLILAILVISSLAGCCHYNDKTKTLYGLGKYKDETVEIESHGPLKDILNIQMVKTN